MGCFDKCCKRAEKEEPKGLLDDSQRKCHDVLCFVLFIIFWIGMFIIAGISINAGDPKRLLYGVNYQGDTCGNGDYSDQKRIVYVLCANLGMSTLRLTQTRALQVPPFERGPAAQLRRRQVENQPP